MKIVRYSQEHKNEWDSFIKGSKNGTFLHCRDFMEYHSDRFSDYSLLFYEKDKLTALLPANIQNDVLFSHKGLTYGGLVINNKVKSIQVITIFDTLISFLKSQKINKFLYKSIPHIYHKYPAEEDLYALSQNGAILSARSISSTIDLSSDRPPYAELRKRQIKKSQQQGIALSETNDFKAFWNILEDNLKDRHNTNPVHSMGEISLLKGRFSANIRLFVASQGENIIAGCLVFETDTVAHVQYISANDEGKQYGALDCLFDWLISDIFAHKKYFDFGISTENEGHYLNEGLISQKEGFGARAIVYDTYTLNI